MYRVVLIDDEAITVEGMSKCFPWEKWDCQVVAAATGEEEGRRIIEEYNPHIIITDIAMPGIDGLEMLSGLKSEFANSSIVKSALKYIEEHYSKQLTLSEVAERIYVSKWHLSKILNQQTGHGFSEILNIVRINHAKELLVDRSLRISDVSEMVGFVNLPHFSRVFKKIVGVSANEYRNKL